MPIIIARGKFLKNTKKHNSIISIHNYVQSISPQEKNVKPSKSKFEQEHHMRCQRFSVRGNNIAFRVMPLVLQLPQRKQSNDHNSLTFSSKQIS